MTWIDKIKDSLIITTGDGKEYYPNWINAKKQVDFNISEFEFPNLAGTLVVRGEPIGRKFDLELYFQGENHLEISSAFEKSANDKRFWKLYHPFYDLIIAQPISLSFDNSEMNVTRISGTIIETIVDDNPKTSIQPIDAIKISKINLDKSFEQSLTTVPSASESSAITVANDKNYHLSVPIIKLPAQFEEYNYAFNQANSFVATATASPLLAIRSTIRLISLPATFAASVSDRVNLLNSQFKLLSASIVNMVSPASKQIYQCMGGSILSSICLAASTPDSGDYGYSNSVLNIMDIISRSYQQFITDLDALQTANGGSPDSYIPSAQALTELNNLINLTISNLFSIALGSRQERIIYTDADTNMVILTHRFYGLDANDSNISEMIANNNLHIDEYIQVKKGRKIVYYI